MLALMASSEPVDHGAGSFSRPTETPAPSSFGPLGFSLVQTLDPREDLFLDGDEASHLYEVTEGIVRLSHPVGRRAPHRVVLLPGRRSGLLQHRCLRLQRPGADARLRAPHPADDARAPDAAAAELAQKLLRMAAVG